METQLNFTCLIRSNGGPDSIYFYWREYAIIQWLVCTVMFVKVPIELPSNPAQRMNAPVKR